MRAMGMAKDWGYCKGSRESYRNWGFSCRSFGDAHLLVETKAGANCLGRKVRRGEKSAPPPSFGHRLHFIQGHPPGRTHQALQPCSGCLTIVCRGSAYSRVLSECYLHGVVDEDHGASFAEADVLLYPLDVLGWKYLGSNWQWQLCPRAFLILVPNNMKQQLLRSH